jgi:transcriptional regulator with XRE-family HTH domain
MESDGHAGTRHAGGNLRAIRSSRGLSQTAIAGEMNGRDWPWHQTTVGRVESGAQSVSLGEAIDLAAILGVSLDRLTMPGEGAAEIAAAEQAATRLRLSWIEAVKGIRHLREAAEAARSVLPGAETSKHPRVRETAALITEDLSRYTFEAAVAEAAKTGEP